MVHNKTATTAEQKEKSRKQIKKMIFVTSLDVCFSLFLFLPHSLSFIFYASFVCHECGWKEIYINISFYEIHFYLEQSECLNPSRAWHSVDTLNMYCDFCCCFRFDVKTSNIIFKYEVKQMWALNAMIKPIQKEKPKANDSWIILA